MHKMVAGKVVKQFETLVYS